MNKKLIFVDANIYLDFYRTKLGLKNQLINKLLSLGECIIVTHQVKMEFMKNRQDIILESMKLLKIENKPQRPCILSEDKSWNQIERSLKDIDDNLKLLKNKLFEIIEFPDAKDGIYLSLKNHFNKVDSISLAAGSNDAARVEESAKKKFLNGNPPRKSGDSSMGDAINWEWICQVAQNEKADVILLSRDQDFGRVIDGKCHLNDYLREEFSERSGGKSQIIYLDKLTDVLARCNIKISASDRDMENEIIDKVRIPLKIGDRVMVSSGVYSGCIGLLFDVVGKDGIILLPVLGQNVKTKIRLNGLEVIDP